MMLVVSCYHFEQTDRKWIMTQINVKLPLLGTVLQYAS